MNIVRQLRQQKGIQQKELALEIGVTNATVSDWEHGRKNPSGERLRKLAEFFDVEPMVILGHEAETQPAPQIYTGKPETDKIIEQLLKRLESLDIQPKTEEARYIANDVDRLPKDQRQKAVAMYKLVFSKGNNEEE